MSRMEKRLLHFNLLRSQKAMIQPQAQINQPTKSISQILPG